MEYYKPIDIARELQISTSALRHYESWGVVPAPERAANGYRLYTKIHLAYFRCLRSLFAGFGVTIACQVLKHVQNHQFDKALWMVNKEQALLHQEKGMTDQTLALLQDSVLPLHPHKKHKSHITIGEAAALTNVQASAIRHWEKEGLITPERDEHNGYRLFTPTHIRQIMLIRSLRKTVYVLEQMKEIVNAVESNSIERAKQVTEDALLTIHERNRKQYIGILHLLELGKQLELI